VSFKIQTGTDNPLNGFALCIVGKGKLFHLSPANDDSLCPASVRSNGIREYVDSERINERDICSRCYKAAEKCHKLAYAARAAETQDDVMSQSGNVSGPVVAYVGIRQGPAGYVAVEHVHAVGCPDIKRTEGKYPNGSDAYAYTSDMTIADILAANYGDIASDGNETNTPEWWAAVMHNANDNRGEHAISGMRFLPCARKTILDGRCDNSPLVSTDDFFRAGFDIPKVENLWHVMVDGEWILTEWKNAGQPVTAWVGDKLKNVEFCHFATSNVGSCTLCSELAPMEDTMDMPLVVSAILRIDIDGVSIPLGCHTFTIPFGNEKSIPTLYGEMHGEWKRPGAPDWDSLITVVESETY
jgi:hypothetical protein